MRLQGGFNLTREGDVLILHATNGAARWFGVFFGGVASYLLCGGIKQGMANEFANWPALALSALFALVGLLMMLRHEITTIFDTRTRRVVVKVSLCNGWYERRQTYAFDEIASLGVREYVGEGYSYMPVLMLRSGKTRWLATMHGGYLTFAKAMGEISATTGLATMDVPPRWG